MDRDSYTFRQLLFKRVSAHTCTNLWFGGHHSDPDMSVSCTNTFAFGVERSDANDDIDV
jgi:hypothetical protein